MISLKKVMTEEELDGAYEHALKLVETLEMKNMLSKEEDKMGAILKIVAVREVPKLRIGQRCFFECTSVGWSGKDIN